MANGWKWMRSRRRLAEELRPSATIQDFFTDSDRLDVIRLRFFSGVFLLVAALTIYGLVKLWFHSPVPFIGTLTTTQTEGRIVGFTFVLGIFASLCSSFAAVYFLNRSSLSRIERVKRLAKQGILEGHLTS